VALVGQGLGKRWQMGRHGRFLYINLAPGSYCLAAVLPNGLSAHMGPVVVTVGKGAAVGITASSNQGFRLYLSVIVRP
jgi:hypothetical protein